jgi:pantoate--beta-alanine ligase
MLKIASPEEIAQIRSTYKPSQKIGFVPTMGYLHEGHLSLVRKARAENDIVIVSIFVNPTQFGPNEDLSKYPQDLDRDMKLLEELGAAIVFTPNNESMYPKGYETYVEPTGFLADEVEGASRPGHFRGMATIVLKLFNIVKPTNAYFGQKDAQQAAIVAQMIKDFNLSINLNVLPTVREEDGLAMSSRNVYLNPKERKAASIIYKALQKGKDIFDKNLDKNVDIVLESIKQTIETEPLVKLEYIEIRALETFAKLETNTSPAIMLIAAKVGKARLIDNIQL